MATDQQVIPPLPAGFQIDGVPPLPAGFQLDAPASSGATGPSDIPRQFDQSSAMPAPTPKESPKFLDYMTAPSEATRTLLQNIVAGPAGWIQGGIEHLGSKLTDNPRTVEESTRRVRELGQRFSHTPTNPVTLQMLSQLEDASKSAPIRALQAFGPGGGILGEVGLTGPAAFGVQALGDQVASGAIQAGNAIGNAAERTGTTLGGAVKRGVSYATGKAADDAAQALKASVSGEVGSAVDALKAQSSELASGRGPNVAPLQDIAGAKLSVADKVAAKAAQADAVAKSQLDALHPVGMSNEDIGALIQTKGTENLDALAAARQANVDKIKTPAFDFARIREGAGDTLTTNASSKPFVDKAVAAIKQAIEDTPEGLRGGMAKQLEALTGGENGLTLHQAEYLRRWAGDSNLRESTGFAALDASRMTELKKNLTEAMKAYEPDVGKYLSNYAVNSQNMDRAVGSNAGKAATTGIVGAGEDMVRNQKPLQAHNYYMDGKQASAQKMVDLVGGKTPDLVDAVKANLRTKLEGLTADQATELAVKNDGLLRVFPEAKSTVNQIIKSKAEAERLAGLSQTASQRSAQAFETATKAKESARAAASIPKELADNFSLGLQKLDGAPNAEALSTARGIVDDLARNKMIDSARYQEMLTQLRNTETVYGKTAKAKGIMRGIVIAAVGSTVGAAGLGVVGH